MYHYTTIQWLMFFYFYCFFGWCFESTYVSIKEKKLTNRGFIRGPFLPLYGSGGIMMLVVSMPFRDSILLTYLAGCVGATVLEYVTGVTMEALFKVRYWDYSTKKFNFQGHICLSSTLAWGFLTILMTHFAHPYIEKMFFMIPTRVATVGTDILTVIIAMDFALAFKAALDLRDILVKLEGAKREMVRMQKRLDVVIAMSADSMGSRIEATGERTEELINSMERKFGYLKESISNIPDSAKQELMELRSRFAVLVDNNRRLSSIKDFYQRAMLRGNPSMYSAQYAEELKEIQKNIKKDK